MMDFSNESEEIIEGGESETSENENESEEEDNEEVIAEILGNLQPYQYEPGNDNESSDSASESNIVPDELSSDDEDHANQEIKNGASVELARKKFVKSTAYAAKK